MQRAVKIRHYLEVMEAMGYTASSVLESSGITVANLNEPGFVIEVHQCKKVVANMMRLTGNQGIGFEVGSRLRLSYMGILAHAISSSRTLWHVIDLWARYDATLAGMLIHLNLAEDGDGNWGFTINEISPQGFLYNFCVEEALTMMQKFSIALTGESPSINRISLTYPPPPHKEIYHRYFDCPIEFNAKVTCITFDAPGLHQPLKTDDDELNEVCQMRCQQIMRQIESNNPVSTRLRGLLLKNSSPLLTLEESAKLMATSPRNLRRQLKLEGATYRDIVNEMRVELAKEYLRAGEFHTKEVSYLLGYKDPDTFRRAFKSWTGQTTREYRAQQNIEPIS